MNFGGPVWHASISVGGDVQDPDPLFAQAARVLLGVGDAAAGEWRDVGRIAVHLRRRLTDAEAAIVGPVVDIRGTWEMRKRLNRVRQYLPAPMRDWPDARLP
jgi:hypothetical protein